MGLEVAVGRGRGCFETRLKLAAVHRSPRKNRRRFS
jgi:hypothetical protein